MEYIQLNDGNKIPAIGFGVFMIPNDGFDHEVILRALEQVLAVKVPRWEMSVA